jgi:hypothetical protein
MERKMLLPALPPSLVGVPLGIEYVGILALAAKASRSASLERFAEVMNNQAQIHPEANDLWDLDAWTREYAGDIFLSSKVLRDPKAVAVLRAQRAKQMQAQQALVAENSASQTGKNMSDIDVGGGMNAVQAMTGLGASPGAQPSGASTT